MKYDSAQEALAALVRPGAIATAYTFNGHGVVMCITAEGDDFVLSLDDGGVAVRRITFKDRNELETILPVRADPLEVGYEYARDSLIKKFIANCVVSDN